MQQWIYRDYIFYNPRNKVEGGECNNEYTETKYSIIQGIELKEENATMNIQRLNVRIDQTEEDLLNEKLKIKVTFCFAYSFLRIAKTVNKCYSGSHKTVD